MSASGETESANKDGAESEKRWKAKGWEKMEVNFNSDDAERVKG